MRKRVGPMVLALAVLVALAAGCGGSSSTATTTDAPTTSAPKAATRNLALKLDALIYLPDERGIARDGNQVGANCGTSNLTLPSDELAHLKPTAQVLVKDGDGKVLATAKLGGGKVSSADAGGYLCQWDVEFGQVPKVAFYDLSIANTPLRVYPADEVEKFEGRVVFQYLPPGA